MSVERVAQPGAVRVLGDHGHVVLDRDPRTEHVLVAPVTVVLLGLPVELAVDLVVPEIEQPGIVGRTIDRAAFGSLPQATSCRVVGAVEGESTGGEDSG